MSEGLFFPQQVGGDSDGNSDYVEDTFDDYTLPATNNSGLTSTSATNPMSNFYGNDLSVKYSFKTLWIKDIELLPQDKWIKRAPTYKVIFTENFPGVDCYVSGEVNISTEINGKYLNLKEGGYFGVSGNLRKASFLVRPLTDEVTISTLFYSIDGAAPTSINYGGIANETTTFGSAVQNRTTLQHKFYPIDDGAAVQTDNIHDFRITNNDNYVDIYGIVVCVGVSPQGVGVKAGSLFVDKSLVSIASGASIALPAQNASLFHLGAKTTLFENASGVLGATTFAVQMLQTQATGLSGTNSIAVSAGSGASFPIGTGFNIQVGATNYLGLVQAQSTDALTVSPTLTFELSGATMTKAFFVPQPATSDPRLFAGFSAALYELAYSWDPVSTYGASNFNGASTRWAQNGPTIPLGISITPYRAYYDPENRFAILPISGLSSAQGRILPVRDEWNTVGWAGPLAIKGDFQALSIEFLTYASGVPIWSTRSTIDGVTTYMNASLNVSNTESGTLGIKFALNAVQDLGIGSHTYKFIPSLWAGYTTCPIITKINFYKYKGVSIAGQLSSIEQYQTQYNLGSITDTPLGSYRFYGADKIGYSGTWSQRTDVLSETLSAYPGFASCQTASGSANFKFWGKDFVLFTESSGGSYSVTLDGGAVTPTSGQIYSVATEMIHNIILTRESGSFAIQGIAVLKQYSEPKNLQGFTGTNFDYSGAKLEDKSVSVMKSKARPLKHYANIGEIATSVAFIDTSISATILWSQITTATDDTFTRPTSVKIKTSGNPVRVGFNSFGCGESGFLGTTLPMIELSGSATQGIYGNLVLARVPRGDGNYTVPYDNGVGTSTWIPVGAQTYGAKVQTTVFLQTFRYPSESFSFIDFPPAGDWQYRVYGQVSGLSTLLTVTNTKLFAMEMF